MRFAVVGLASILGAIACSQPSAPPPVVAPPAPRVEPAPPVEPAAKSPVTLTIIGTNDLHGALERLPIFAGFVANVRAARARDGGGVILLDGGDMFQGTLESNITEGLDVVRAYNEIGYTAAAIGNHEFDFGPEGPKVMASSSADDARGALKARAAEAKFPFLSANIVDQKTDAQFSAPNIRASTLVDASGIKVGIIGASTESTPFTTMPANFVGLAMTPAPGAVAAEARKLRAGGAQVVVLTAHLGTKCKKVDDPDDSSSCDPDDELFRLIRELPRGAVDVVVAGHTHAAVAHRVDGVAAIESYSSGRAFGRVDLHIAPAGGVTAVRIDKPHAICGGEIGGNPVPAASCKPGDYEGQPVVADPRVQAIVDEAVARAAVRRAEKLGVTLQAPVTKSYDRESAEGNWFNDLMLLARPDAQVALSNGGGLRADMAAGELTYGQLFEAMPFDNRFAIVPLRGAQLRDLVATNLQQGGAFLTWGGLTARARCKGDTLDVQVMIHGKPLVDGRTYRVVTSDFLASGGSGVLSKLELPEGAVEASNVIIREALADLLRKLRGAKARIDPARLFSPGTRRIDYEGERPLKCGG